MSDISASISERALVRERALDLKSLYERVRVNSPRWQALDGIYQRQAVLLARAGSSAEAETIFRAAVAELETVAALDDADREAERRKPNLADDARLFEQRRQARIEWARRVGKSADAAARLLIERVNAARQKLSIAESEADIREALTDFSDAMRAMSASVSLEFQNSIDRQSAAEKAAA